MRNIIDRLMTACNIVAGVILALFISLAISKMAEKAHSVREAEAEDTLPKIVAGFGAEQPVVLSDETETEIETENTLPKVIAGYGAEQPVVLSDETETETETETQAKAEVETEENRLTGSGNVINTHYMEPGKTIDPVCGVFQGPWLKETYYNLNMNYCIEIMKWLGIGETYGCWVREDGVKMFGDYIMCAADTNVFPKGSIVETSLGTAMVVDHCEAAEWCPEFDIAVTW